MTELNITFHYQGSGGQYPVSRTRTKLSLMMQDAYPITIQSMNALISKINELEDRVEILENGAVRWI